MPDESSRGLSTTTLEIIKVTVTSVTSITVALIAGYFAIIKPEQTANAKDKLDNYYTKELVNEYFISKLEVQAKYLSLDSVQANFIPKKYLKPYSLGQGIIGGAKQIPMTYLIHPSTFTYEFPDYVPILGYSSAISLSPSQNQNPPYVIEIRLYCQEKDQTGSFAYALGIMINGNESGAGGGECVPTLPLVITRRVDELPPNKRIEVRFHFVMSESRRYPIEYIILPGSTIAVK